MVTTKIVKFLEFFSVLGFGLAYWRFDLQIATIVLMVLMTLFVVTAKLLGEPLTKLQVGTWIIVISLGLATVLLHDERFIKWKTTVINAVLALAFALSHVIGQKTLVERLIAEKIKAPKTMLRRVNFALVLHLLLTGALNLLFAYRFDTTIWVNYKLFGTLLLNFLFLAGAFYYLRPYLKDFLDHLEKKGNSSR